MSKLYRARALLYRRQILQENIRWKALEEIYKIYMLLHRSDLNVSAKLCQFFAAIFFAFFGIFVPPQNAIFQDFPSNFALILMIFSRIFAPSRIF